MVDRVTDYGMKSLAHHLLSDVALLDNAYVVGPDFDWNTSPDPNDPGNSRVNKPLPYAAVALNDDSTPPFSVGNILYEQMITAHIYSVASSYTEMIQSTADIKQSLKSASNPITGSIGITLYNFASPSGGFFENAGTLQIDFGTTNYFGVEEVKLENNLKYRSITPITMSAYKDATATLLENMGRVDLTDT